MFNLNNLVRENIRTLKPYSSARDEFQGKHSVMLDANEINVDFSNSSTNALANYNRYPDPQQLQLKKAIATLKNVDSECIFLGNGSDECIDVVYKSFCDSGKDNVIICPPTYGMYEVAANIFNTVVRPALLTQDFQLNLYEIEKLADKNTKLLWICSPNNPTGNSIDRAKILSLLNSFNGIVILDEAYIDFSASASFLDVLNDHPNLIILQTFSKAWGLAALRLGMAFASPSIIKVMTSVKPPYNINAFTQDHVLKCLGMQDLVKKNIGDIVQQRNSLAFALERYSFVEKVYPSDANFLLVKVKDAKVVYKYLLDQRIVVRDRSNVTLCDDCLRITIGSKSENQMLTNTLNNFK